MSIREYLDENNHFNHHAIKTNKMNIGGITHELYNNQYLMKDKNGQVLMGFNEDKSLSDSSLKQYCDAILGTVNELNLTQLSVLGSMQRQITTLNINIQNVPTDANYEELQAEIQSLKTYNTNLKNLVLALKESLYISKSSIDASEFNFDNLL
jgi:hypothetical protein